MFFITWIGAGIVGHLLLIVSQIIFDLRIRRHGQEPQLHWGILYKAITGRVLLGYLILIIACIFVFFVAILPDKYIKDRARRSRAMQYNKKRSDINIPRIEISVSLDALINSDCDPEEHMKKVILFAQTLPDAAGLEFVASVPKKNHDENIVTGYTPEHGNVTTHFDENEQHQEDPFSLHKERVGLFRIWMVYDNLIGFHHFWSSDETTSVPEASGGKRPDIYYIEFDIETLKPLCLAINAPKLMFRAFGATFYRIELEPLWGKLTDPKRNAGYGVY